MNAEEPCSKRIRHDLSAGNDRAGRGEGVFTLVMDSRVETLVMMRSVKPTSASSAGTKQPEERAFVKREAVSKPGGNVADRCAPCR